MNRQTKASMRIAAEVGQRVRLRGYRLRTVVIECKSITKYCDGKKGAWESFRDTHQGTALKVALIIHFDVAGRTRRIDQMDSFCRHTSA